MSIEQRLCSSRMALYKSVYYYYYYYYNTGERLADQPSRRRKLPSGAFICIGGGEVGATAPRCDAGPGESVSDMGACGVVGGAESARAM